MKKLLLATTAVAGLALLASPASAADGLKLDLGGFFKGYAVMTDHDDDYLDTGESANFRSLEFRRHAEVHFTGETTLDNGLTVGAHTEMNIVDDAAEPDSTGDSFDEAYVYFSGGWGRINWGAEDGAAYLLQVEAPSADSNVDGLRVWFDAFNYGFDASHDYAHADFEEAERVTYLTPKYSGFQAGVSYAPNATSLVTGNNIAAPQTDNDDDEFDNAWELAARWDGEFEGVGLSVGGGWSTADVEADGGVFTDDIDTWNAGANLSWNAFSLGGAYRNSEVGADLSGFGLAAGDLEQDTWVAGLGWENGPYHLGLSYIDTEFDQDPDEVELDRWTGGGTYTFGPGMTLRGTVSRSNLDTVDVAGTDESAWQYTLGTQVNF